MLDMLKGLLDGKLEEVVKVVADAIVDESVVEQKSAKEKLPEPKMSPKGDLKIFELQKKLIARGAKITADGIDGPATRRAVQDFPDGNTTPPVTEKFQPVVSGKPVISLEQIKSLFPKHKDPSGLTAALNTVLPKYDITGTERVACFLAQCGHESGGFSMFVENLNYSAESLCKVWPKRFTSATAGAYNRNPEKIANKVYCDRMGNGSEASGDGWKYRGRGAIQLTGKDNYTKFSKSCGKSLDETVAYCETLEGAVASGAYFWKENRLNERFVDKKDFVGLTKAINGGEHGLSSRLEIYKTCINVL
jgi:putative chitinase